MGIDVFQAEHRVFLKTNAHDSELGNFVDTIPLKTNTITVNVGRTVPAIPIPLSSIIRGESETIAVDLGMATKTISISGILTNTTIKRSHTGSKPNFTSLNMTAEELAQLLAAGVDSSGLAHYQNFNELVFLIDSNIDENFTERTTVEKIPFNFTSRGSALEKDNERVALPSDFPTGENSNGVSGFIESFDFTISADSPTEIEFSLSFRVARIFP